ncbi:MAG: ribonuclease E/G [Cellulosilyticaceae bacterium]
MQKVILIDNSLTYTKVGVVLENQLQEIYLQNNFEQDLQNAVIQGQIMDVVKNLQAVFVDFGGDKNGLLHFKQIPECYKTRLRAGERLPIQIMRENVGTKGHKLTAYINLIGKHLVCLPFEKGISISKKIVDEKVRERIKACINTCSISYGFIARTSSSEVDETELISEIEELTKQADTLMKGQASLAKGSLLVKDNPLPIKIILEHLKGRECLKIISNDHTILEQIKQNFGQDSSEIVHEYIYLNSLENVFKFYDVEKQFEEALKKRVWLKNGGNLIIEPTEALTVVDVNSAKAVMKKNPNRAILQLNQLAIEESIRQIIKRNIAGMIVIDLVDVRSREDKQALYEFATQLIKRLEGKRAVAYPITELGLLQISRTKKYMSLYQSVYTKCNLCDATSRSYRPSYLSYLLEIKIKNIIMHTTNRKLFITCIPALYEYLKNQKIISKFEQIYEISIDLTKETKESTNFFNITYHI